MLQRRPEWQTALHGFLLSQQSRRFCYGEFDCCLFVGDAILSMTGTDIARAFRSGYSSRREALELIKRYTGRASIAAVAEQIAAEHDMRELPLPFAQRGDMILLKRSRDFSLGLLDLNGREILAASKNGLLRLLPARACRAWRV